MPFVNGVKMACGPCIRGHRSTKCTHASERVMIPVRKPGRPLSSCACAPGRPCQCGGGLRVAIPKVKKCACGPEGVEEEDEDDGEHTVITSASAAKITPLSTPSISSPAPPSYRVSKTSSVPRQGSRKQSLQAFDPINLERMKSDSVNIMSSYNQAGRALMTPMSNVITHPVSMAPTPGPGAPIEYVFHGPANGFGNDPNIAYTNGASMTYTIAAPRPPPSHIAYGHGIENEVKHEKNGIRQIPKSLVMPPPASTIAPALDGSQRQSIHASVPPMAPAPAKKSGGSSCCCSGSDKTEMSTAKSNEMSPSGSFQYGVVSQFPPVQFPEPQPTTFTYPAQYGSWQNPINPMIWQQLVTQQSIAAGERTGVEDGTSHDCSCGAGCECVGCLAHPYNSGTLAYITDAYNEQHGFVNGNGGRNGTSYANTNGTNGTNGTHGNQKSAYPASCCGGKANVQSEPEPPSPPMAQTPSDASGTTAEEQLSMSDYLFLDMPFDGNAFESMDGNLGLCNGSVVLCTCGPECQCEGCEIHNGHARGAL